MKQLILIIFIHLFILTSILYLFSYFNILNFYNAMLVSVFVICITDEIENIINKYF